MNISSIIRSRFFIAGFLFLGAAALSLVWAMKLMESISDYRSPLRYQPPVAQEPFGHAITQRLVIILVDGLREDTSRDSELMPYLQTLRQEGAWAVMHSRPLSYSQPGYSTLFIGAWPDINDGPAINLDQENLWVWTQDNLFTAVHRVGGRTAVAANSVFEMMIPKPDIDAFFYTDQANRAGDEEIFDQVSEWIDGGGQSLMLVHFSQVDDAGDNLGGTQSQAWADAASRVDGMIQDIGAKLDFTKDTLMIVSDHGQIDGGGHGGPEPDNLIEPFLLAGAGVWPGYFGNMQMVDVAPTAAAMLGAAVPASSQGHILEWMLDLNGEVNGVLQDRIQAQQETLYVAYTSAIGYTSTLKDNPAKDIVVKYEAGIERARENRRVGEVMGRIFLLILPAFVGGYFGWKFLNRKLLERVALFVPYALGFCLVYLILFRQTFSLSRVQSETGLIVGIVASSAAGFLAAWLITVFWRRIFSSRPEQLAEETLALAGVFITLLILPVAAHFIVNGTIASWTLPEMNTGFFGLLSMIQIVALAVLGALFAAGSVLGKQLYEQRIGESQSRMNFVPASEKGVLGQPSGRAKKRTGRGGRKR